MMAKFLSKTGDKKDIINCDVINYNLRHPTPPFRVTYLSRLPLFIYIFTIYISTQYVHVNADKFTSVGGSGVNNNISNNNVNNSDNNNITMSQIPSTIVYDGSVVEITDSNFMDILTSTSGLWIVKFVAPWCSHCKTLRPEFIKAAHACYQMGHHLIKYGSIDVTQNPTLRDVWGVYAFPTIKLFNNGEFVRDINAVRSAEGLVDFTETISRPLIHTLPSPLDLQYIQSTNLSNSILFDPSTKVGSLYWDTIDWDRETAKPVTAFILTIDNNVEREVQNKAVALFELMALKYVGHHLFILSFTDGSGVDEEGSGSHNLAPALQVIGENIYDKIPSLIWPFNREEIDTYITRYRWPYICQLDHKRFINMKEGSEVLSVVVLAADFRSKSLKADVEALREVAGRECYRQKFLFGWLDAAKKFKRGFEEFGPLQLPEVIVFGAGSHKNIYINRQQLNLTELGAGLDLILSGSLSPFSSSGRMAALRSAQIVINKIYTYAGISKYHAVLVFLMTTACILTMFFACYYFVLEFEVEDCSMEEDAIPIRGGSSRPLGHKDDINDNNNNNNNTISNIDNKNSGFKESKKVQ